MDALQQRIEVESGLTGNEHFAVDDASLGKVRLHRGDHLGEVAREWTFVATAELDLVAVAEHDAAEAVPLRLVEPAVALRQLVGRLREHRRDGRHDG